MNQNLKLMQVASNFGHERVLKFLTAKKVQWWLTPAQPHSLITQHFPFFRLVSTSKIITGIRL